MRLEHIMLSLCLVAAPAVGLADETAPPPQAQIEHNAVQAWGRYHADCAEWSDGCVACTKEGCSTPGIACTPQEIVCRRK